MEFDDKKDGKPLLLRTDQQQSTCSYSERLYHIQQLLVADNPLTQQAAPSWKLVTVLKTPDSCLDQRTQQTYRSKIFSSARKYQQSRKDLIRSPLQVENLTHFGRGEVFRSDRGVMPRLPVLVEGERETRARDSQHEPEPDPGNLSHPFILIEKGH